MTSHCYTWRNRQNVIDPLKTLPQLIIHLIKSKRYDYMLNYLINLLLMHIIEYQLNFFS